MSQEVFEIVRVLVYLVILVIGYMIIPYIKTYIYDTKYQLILDEAVNVVQNLQQVMSKEENKEKKRHALEYLITYADKIGFKITVEQASVLIESAVYAMKHTMERK